MRAFRMSLRGVFGWVILAGFSMGPAFPFLSIESARAQELPNAVVPEVPAEEADPNVPPGTEVQPGIPSPDSIEEPPEAIEAAPEEPLPPETPEPAPPVEVPPPTPTFPGVAPPPGFGQPPGVAPSGPGSARIAVEGDLVNLDFADADIQDVVKQISEITGRNFILDERVRGKITIISPGKVTVDEAYKVFESVLNVKGFATIPAGKFLKIVPLREAKEGNIATYPDGARVPERDTYVTRLIPLRYVDATDISNSLKPLVSRDASMIPYGPTNTIILSDSSYNINKILDIIQQVDVSSYQETLEIIQLQYADAREIADEISQVFGETGQGAAGGGGTVRRLRQTGSTGQPGQAGPKIITDERTNSLIILASPRQIDDIRSLIRRLDYQTGRGRIHVYYLENADAKDLAETLAGLGVGEGGGQRGAAGAAAQGQPGGVPAAVAATVAELGEGVKITHDEPTNSLIIESSPEAYETIREVIEKLDIKRPQVLVEALLLEVSIGPNTLSTGVALAGGDFFDQNKPINGGIFGNTAFSTNPPSGAGSGLITAAGLASILNGSGTAGTDPLFGSLVSGFKAVNVKTAGADGKFGTADDGVVPVPVIRAAIQAAAARTDTNILSAPNILTTDNQEAEIQVGQNIPIQTAAVSSTASGTGTVDDNTLVNNSFERQDVGVILKVTPQISEGDSVRLEVSNEITEVAGGPVGLPTLTKRSIKNTVVVADGATVVIGGIISSALSKSSNRVPWLGDIPGLGWAFKNKSKSLRKINLIVFLTPHIVRSPEDLRRVTNYKQKEFETKSREALRPTDEEERRERETKEKAQHEGKSVEEYEDKYNLNRARSPIDQALKDIKKRNVQQGEDPTTAAPRASPGRREEVIGEPESRAPDTDATGRVIAAGRAEEPPAPRAPEAPPAASPARTASIPAGNYTVQVGAFPDRQQAERLTTKLKDERYDVYVTSAVVTGGGVVHRVRVGRFEKESEARQVASKLQDDLAGEETVPFVVKLAQ